MTLEEMAQAKTLAWHNLHRELPQLINSLPVRDIGYLREVIDRAVEIGAAMERGAIITRVFTVAESEQRTEA